MTETMMFSPPEPPEPPRSRLAEEGELPFGISFESERRHWLRARTLRLLRWTAILGQFMTVVVGHIVLGFDLPLPACLAVILLAVWFNIIADLLLPPNRRLSERAALTWLLFDATQLAMLLALTGGLNNPFVMLFLAPVTVAAAALTPRAAVITATLCLVYIVGLHLWHLPLIGPDGQPLLLPDYYRLGVAGALIVGFCFIGIYVRRVAAEAFRMSQALSVTQAALGREQRLSALGALAAAAAHELGTPLATIALTARELERDLRDDPESAEDMALIRQQTTRCRDILAELSRTARGEDHHTRVAPVPAVVEEAAAPFMAFGKQVVLRLNGAPLAEATPETAPHMRRRPEVIHGLRNLVQNAVDFAAVKVRVEIDVTEDQVVVTVGDDGPGFNPETLDRIGEPFISTRARGALERGGARGHYEGMGLGLFIAKTLLERTGATVTFANARQSRRAETPEVETLGGAIVTVSWRREEIETGR